MSHAPLGIGATLLQDLASALCELAAQVERVPGIWLSRADLDAVWQTWLRKRESTTAGTDVVCGALAVVLSVYEGEPGRQQVAERLRVTAKDLERQAATLRAKGTW